MTNVFVVETLKNLNNGNSVMILPDHGFSIPMNADGELIVNQLALHRMLKGVKPGSTIYVAAKNNDELSLSIGSLRIPQ